MSFMLAETLMDFQFNIRTRVVFGAGSSGQVGHHAGTLGIQKAMLVTDKDMAKADSCKSVTEALSSSGIQVETWDGVRPDPPEETVDEGASFYAQSGCDGLIGFGGGSSMDTAKIIGALAVGGGKVKDYDMASATRQITGMPPLICIPTTSGTGSEVTALAVWTDGQTGAKKVMGSALMNAHVGLVDPGLTVSMPPMVTASTGMDAFAHAIESYTSSRNNPVSDALGLYAIELVSEYLPKAVEDGTDMDARTKMSAASVMAGMAFNHAFPHFAHAIGHVLGSKYHTPHGMACALVLRAGLELNKDVMLEKYGKVAQAMGVKVGRLSKKAAADAAIEAVSTLMKKIGIPSFAEATGAQEADIEELADLSMKEIGLIFNPKPLSKDDVTTILRESMSGGSA